MLTLNRDARVAIESHAVRCYPNEACGLIVQGDYIPCTNIGPDPARGFVIPSREYANAEDQGEIQAIVHSHPDAGALPSIEDLTACATSSIAIWIIVNVSRDQEDRPYVGRFHLFSKSVEGCALIGLRFAHGTNDCYGLVRRYYRAAIGLNLPDFSRSGIWWDDGQSSLYMENYKAAGFVSIGCDASLHEGDVLLMAVASRRGIPNHAAVYLGDDTILHHLWNQLSRREGLPRYRAHVTHVLRHRDMLEWNR
ncbi:Mov34/MPN/PAD-1 family protein [Caballeronia sp. LZ035]|uniref:C40 family peptidase n=1 Tax=Caballeronia sp. LZ035 TaxID=3038568 RepID=UPI002863885B|nr:Mov34/MPN/PAD-1 family protein [Caballeronia sp. LZ035]MDR5756508.1 Mov34/MPN/PAD-1 family protein [Caballeronia sp. LZ035]